MSKKQPKHKPFKEQCMWYVTIFCGLLFLMSIVPVVPWRYAKMDSAMGNRFVMDRYYTIFGATDAFGSRVGWMTLSRKVQRKVEEFCRPNPMNMLLGAAASMSGSGGAAVGCVGWEQCKNHIKARYYKYSTIGMAGIVCTILLLFSVFACVGVVLAYNFEDAGKSKKKKKKKHDDNPCDFSPMAKTAICAGIAFSFSFIGTSAFVFLVDSALKEFKRTAYYPYAMSHAGAYAAGTGCFLMFFVMMFLINRVHPFCGKKDEHAGEGEALGGEGEWGGPPGGGYGYGGGGGQGGGGGGYGGAESWPGAGAGGGGGGGYGGAESWQGGGGGGGQGW